MELIVKSNSPYKELIVVDTNAKMSSGLLDKNEMIDMARQLVDCAYGILPPGSDDVERILADLLNNELSEQ